MDSNKTVILGEASEDSDGEEIALDGEQPDSCDQTLPPMSSGVNEKSRLHSSSLFSTIGQSSSALAKLVQYTSSYNPFNLSTISSNHQHLSQTSRDTTNTIQNLSLLHRTLFFKNQQLYASLNHLFRHPLEKASKDMHNISHRLVNVQKGIQEIESAVTKIGREQKNFAIKIELLAYN